MGKWLLDTLPCTAGELEGPQIAASPKMKKKKKSPASEITANHEAQTSSRENGLTWTASAW